MNDLNLFDYQGQQVRTVIKGEEVWFVASDVARVLAYRMASDMTRRLRDSDKGYAKVRTPSGDQQMTVINESGLYDAVFRSNAEGALPFRYWVTGEVIPSIRKHGVYATPDAVEKMLADPDTLIQALTTIKEERAARAVAEEKANQMEQRATVSEHRLDTIEHGNGFSVREFHKHYFPDVPERQFNDLLYSKGLLIDQRNKRPDKNGDMKKPGKQHRHPTATGKDYFFLDPYIDRTGDRHYNTLVRPGTPETELVAKLERLGLQRSKHTLHVIKEIPA
jgi:anti-repressor protein